MRYFTEDLQLNIENAELLIPLEICRVEEIGFMNKDGFVEGWKAVGYVDPLALLSEFANNHIGVRLWPSKKLI
jgi:hypothetical protein